MIAHGKLEHLCTKTTYLASLTFGYIPDFHFKTIITDKSLAHQWVLLCPVFLLKQVCKICKRDPGLIKLTLRLMGQIIHRQCSRNRQGRQNRRHFTNNQQHYKQHQIHQGRRTKQPTCFP